MRGRLLACALAGAMALAGCSGGGEPEGEPTATASPTPTTSTTASTSTPTPTPTSEPAAAAEPQTEAFMQAVVSSDVDTLTQARETLAVPGSPAADYLGYSLGAVRSNDQAGYDNPAGELEQAGNGAWEVCDPDGSGGTTCNTFADFEVDDQGRVVTFTINDNPVGTRLAGPADPQQVGEVTATLLSGYKAGAGNLIVVIEAANDGDEAIDPLWSSAEYVAPGGQQVTAGYAQGATPLRAGASTVAALSFGDQELGGTVYVPLAADGRIEEEELTFDLAAR